jgi:hypothetical protein
MTPYYQDDAVTIPELVAALRNLPPTNDPENLEIRVLQAACQNAADVIEFQEAAIHAIEREAERLMRRLSDG